jgi:signal transduction histidine kinase
VLHLPSKWPVFGLFLIFTCVAATAALDRVGRLGRAAEHSSEAPFVLAASLLEAHHNAYTLKSRLHDAIAAGRPESLARLRGDMGAIVSRLHEALSVALAPHLDANQVTPPLARDLSAWAETRDRIIELAEQGRWSDAHAVLSTDGETAFHQVHLALNRVMTAERERANHLANMTREAETNAVIAAIILAVAAGSTVAVACLGSILFARTHRPLMRLRGALLALAEGKSDMEVPYRDHSGAIGAMARAIVEFQRSQAERHAAVTALTLSEERLLRAVAEAGRADEAKNRFLAAASHDLRQPIQAIRLFLDTLEMRLVDKGDRLVLSGALKALSAGEDLLRDYLDVSVLEAGIVEPTMTDMAIAPLLTKLTAECRPAATERGLRLTALPCTAIIRSDSRLLYRLLRNLLTNAVRYTIEGGILVGCRRRGDSLRIEVWDTGIGIPEDKLNAVFEDFFQLANPERDRTKGLGLGLSVVGRTARLLGYRIELRSTLGRGSVFTVTVPLAPQAKDTALQAA